MAGRPCSCGDVRTDCGYGRTDSDGGDGLFTAGLVLMVLILLWLMVVTMVAVKGWMVWVGGRMVGVVVVGRAVGYPLLDEAPWAAQPHYWVCWPTDAISDITRYYYLLHQRRRAPWPYWGPLHHHITAAHHHAYTLLHHHLYHKYRWRTLFYKVCRCPPWQK